MITYNRRLKSQKERDSRYLQAIYTNRLIKTNTEFIAILNTSGFRRCEGIIDSERFMWGLDNNVSRGTCSA